MRPTVAIAILAVVFGWVLPRFIDYQQVWDALTEELSSVSDDVLVAAALLWRVFYSIISLPLGAITLARFQKANPDMLRRLTVQPT